MSEQTPNSQEPEIHFPSPEKLSEGYRLLPEETIAIPIEPSRISARRSYSASNGMIVEGVAVAVVQVGGIETCTTGLVINTFNGPNRNDAVLIFDSPEGKQPITMKLERGQLLGIGRKFEGQEGLPDTISRDHCAIGLNESDQLVIENHNPTNITAVKTLGKK